MESCTQRGEGKYLAPRADCREQAATHVLGALSIRTALLLHDAVKRVVTLTLVANLASNWDVGRRTRNHLAVLVHVGNGNLHRRMILGLNETASSSTLARHVKINNLALNVSANTTSTRTWSFSMVFARGRKGGTKLDHLVQPSLFT